MKDAVSVRVLFFLILLLRFSEASAAADKRVTFFADTPLFRAPSLEAEQAGTIPEDITLPVVDEKRVLLRHNPMVEGHHPLSLCTRFYAIREADGGILWASRDLGLWPEENRIALRVVPRNDRLCLFVTLALASILLLWNSIRSGVYHRVLSRPGISARRDVLAVLGGILAAYFTGFCWLLLFSGNLIATPTDEFSYFRIALDILHWRRPLDWDFNISVAVLYFPFMVLLHAREYLDILTSILICNSVFLTGTILIFSFLIAQRLTGSTRSALLTVVLLIVLPVIYYPVEMHSGQPGQPSVFKALFGLPGFHPMSYRLYYLFVWSGYNGLSDTPAACTVLLAIWLGLALRGRVLPLAAVSLVFGFACLMRINNVFFAPLVGLLLWQRLQENSVGLKGTVWRAILCLSCAVLVVFPQFVANALQFGDPFTFPYILHNNRASEGFNWNQLWGSTRYLMSTNWVYVTAGCTALLLMPGNGCRRVLVLWIVPLLFFFCGYTVVGASPMRFILPLYPAFALALVTANCWQGRGTGMRDRTLLGGLLVLNVLLVAPCQRFHVPLPYAAEINPELASVFRLLAVVVPLVSIFFCHYYLREANDRRFGFVWLAVFHSGLPIVVLIVFGFLFVRESVSWGREVVNYYMARAPKG